MLTYQSVKETYRQILAQNPGKALRLYGGSKVIVVLDGDTLRWGQVKEDGSIELASMTEIDGHAWMGCGWFGEHQATKKAIDNPILLDLPIRKLDASLPLTYETAITSYRKILEQNPGKAMRVYDARVGAEAAVLIDGKVFWAKVNGDGFVTVEKYEMCDNAWRGGGWFGAAKATQEAISNPVLIDLPVETLTLAPAPAGSPAGLVRVQAPWSGEMLRGMRVAAWRWKDGRGFWDYATHWSTGPQDRQERVYTEADMLAVLASRDAAIAALKALDAESALDCSGCETDYLLAAKNKAKVVLCDAGESDFDRILMQVLES
jgi:hypothetical protein